MAARGTKHSVFLRGLLRVLSTITCLIAVASLGARLGRVHWSADWLTHFHDAYFFSALGLCLGFVFFKRYLWAFLAASMVLFNSVLLLPYLPKPVPTNAEPALRLYSHNIYYLNNNLEAITADVKKYNPDIVFLMEYSTAIQAAIEEDFVDYPYRLIEPSRYTMGLALFSRIPFENAEVVRFETTRIPIFHLEFLVDGKPVSFVGGHPWPPLPRWGTFHRQQMQTLTDVASEAKHPLIVTGDFNASPWSYTVRRLRLAAKVQDARRGFGFGKTWRFGGFLSLLIDQLLISEEWQVLNFVYGDWGGSDHAPLVVDLALKANK